MARVSLTRGHVRASRASWSWQDAWDEHDIPFSPEEWRAILRGSPLASDLAAANQLWEQYRNAAKQRFADWVESAPYALPESVVTRRVDLVFDTLVRIFDVERWKAETDVSVERVRLGVMQRYLAHCLIERRLSNRELASLLELFNPRLPYERFMRTQNVLRWPVRRMPSTLTAWLTERMRLGRHGAYGEDGWEDGDETWIVS